MKYQVGDMVECEVEIMKNKCRRLLIKSPERGSELTTMYFPVVAIDETLESCKIIIEEDMPGWYITRFHIEFEDVDPSFMGAKFYDISESLILSKKK